MELEPITLSHRDMLEPRLKKLAPQLSEYSFANLYLFRHVHKYELTTKYDGAIKGVSYDGARFLMPTSLEAMGAMAATSTLDDDIDCIFPIEERWLGIFDEAKWQRSSNEADSDYLFAMDLMATYKGRHLSKKRNLVKQLLELGSVEHSSLNASNKVQAYKILENWQAPGESADTAACKEAIDLLDKLGLDGELFCVNNEAVGFLIGEAINHETYVIHFAKADIRYKGIYQYMYQALAQKLNGTYAFLNMEQDMGHQELRQAKHSYQPLRMCPKWRLSLKRL